MGFACNGATTWAGPPAHPNVMKGYWKNPEATVAAMTADGYLRTGDVAIMDEDGYVYIVDRIKDMLLVGGFNVYPRSIEEAIYQHPAVEEVGSHRRSRRLSWRKAESLRQTQGWLAASDARRVEGVSERLARQARDDRRVGAARRPAEDRGRLAAVCSASVSLPRARFSR